MSDTAVLNPVGHSPGNEYKGPSNVSTTNACKLCTPLGATLAFKGVEGAVPFLHGSQGCATYMRRYIISHFREPMDIASSALGEKNAIYGGGPNLKKGLLNAMQKYGAGVIGVATTCLTETIGDDVARLLTEFREEFKDLPLAELVHVSTPSYSGTHMDGFHGAVKALADQLCVEKTAQSSRVNLFPGMVSPADIRHLKEICRGFGAEPILLPDYSETLDGPALLEYENLPSGGTPLADIRAMSSPASWPARLSLATSAEPWLRSALRTSASRISAMRASSRRANSATSGSVLQRFFRPWLTASRFFCTNFRSSMVVSSEYCASLARTPRRASGAGRGRWTCGLFRQIALPKSYVPEAGPGIKGEKGHAGQGPRQRARASGGQGA